MQRLIRSEFVNHTIIAVAHRLDTIIDFDAVAVLDQGKIIEHDCPQNLLSRDSAFRELYQIQKGRIQTWQSSVLSLLAGVRMSTVLMDHDIMQYHRGSILIS